MEGLLAWAEQRYEVVIVDSPAVLPVVDASVVAPMMNGVLLVIAAHEVTVNALKMAKYRLDHINAPILGCVLNKVKIARYAYSYHGYQPYADTQTV
jgi:Mrp family chromosome partitioning ATPase